MVDSPDNPETAEKDDGFESQLEDIRIRLASFDGPLDLLVHLIKKHQVNVYDIPIALITQQYLEYLSLMQELNLDLASEFLVMAATLIHIKSRTLLPRHDPAQDDVGEDEDPRDALVRRLLEHQKFKAAAGLLHDRETLRSAQWTRPDSRVEALVGEDYEPELEVDLFSLLSAFRLVLQRARERPPIPLPPEQMSIEARIDQLLDRLSVTEACGFGDLFEDAASRADMIVTFLALLEMIRLKLIRVFQAGQLGAIRIYKRVRPQDAPHPIHDPEDEYKAHHPAKGAKGAKGAEGAGSPEGAGSADGAGPRGAGGADDAGGAGAKSEGGAEGAQGAGAGAREKGIEE